MKKLMIAVASAMAVGLAAQANDWFNGGIKEGWPETATGGEWSNTNGTTYADSKLTVSADADKPLTFAATTEKKLSSDKVAITSRLTFTSFDALPEIPTGAKAGVISYGGKFYVIAKVGEANAWKDSDITAKDEALVKVTFVDGNTAVYDIDGAVSTNEIVSITEVSKVCMSGDGAIAELSATADAKGPSIDPGTGGDPEMTPTITNVTDKVYAIELKDGDTTTKAVKVDGLAADDTLVVPVQIDTVNGVANADQVKVAAPATNETVTVETPIDITPAFTITVTDGAATIELNKGAVVPVVIGEAEPEDVPVTPELDPKTATPFVATEDQTDVAAHTIPGLTYQLKRFKVLEVEGKRDYTSIGDPVKAKGTTTTLTDTTEDRPVDKAFYVIEVTK